MSITNYLNLDPQALIFILVAGTTVALIGSFSCLSRVIHYKRASSTPINKPCVLCVNKKYYKAHFISGNASGDVIFSLNAELDGNDGIEHVKAWLSLKLQTQFIYVFDCVEVGFDKFTKAKNSENSLSANITV